MAENVNSDTSNNAETSTAPPDVSQAETPPQKKSVKKSDTSNNAEISTAPPNVSQTETPPQKKSVKNPDTSSEEKYLKQIADNIIGIKNDINLYSVSTNNHTDKKFQALEKSLQTIILIQKNSFSALPKTLNKYLQSIDNNFQDYIGNLEEKLTGVEKKVQGIDESTEILQSLPRKIDDIAAILKSANLQTQSDIPAINPDEETLKTLTEYGERILQQLSLAARWYARRLPDLNAQETLIKNLTAKYENEKKIAAQEGEMRGRKSIIKELFKLYGDGVHKLFEAAEGTQISILVNFLKNQGVEVRYKVNQELEITEKNILKHEPYIENLKLGKILITAPAYVFDNEVLARATYIQIQ